MAGENTVDFIYRIATLEDWMVAEQNGVYAGKEIDHKDGYIHLSTARQAAETARLYFSGVAGLVLLQVDVAQLIQHGQLRWEAAEPRGGQMFPHFYSHTGGAELPVAAIVKVHKMPLGEDGKSHVFPENLP